MFRIKTEVLILKGFGEIVSVYLDVCVCVCVCVCERERGMCVCVTVCVKKEFLQVVFGYARVCVC